MSTEIYYFSGTGNSLHIARELQKMIPDSSLIPIVGLLDKETVHAKGKTVGFIFPIHAVTIPIAMKKFIKNADLGPAEYLFAIATRKGSVFRGFERIDRLLRKKNKRLSSYFIINMYGNDSRQKGYKVPTRPELLWLEKAALKKLDSIKDIISNKTAHREKDSAYTIDFGHHPVINYLLEKLILTGMLLSEYTGGVNYLNRSR